jgi:hypothetical protein
MALTLKVKPDDKVIVWAIHVDGRPVVDFNRDLEAFINVGLGEHRLTYEVRGAGSTLAIDIAERPRIVQPQAEWPFEVEVPDNRPVNYDALYFEVA